MILFIGIPTERPLEMAIDAAKNKGIAYMVFNQREAQHYNIAIEMKGGVISGDIQLGTKACSLDFINGVYSRMMDPNQLPEIKDKIFKNIGSKASAKNKMIHRQLIDWMDVSDARVLSKSAPCLSNMSKPYQSQLIADCGFKVPATCVTSDMDSLKKFRNENEQVIFKSISSIRSIVKTLDSSYMQHVENMKWLPVQFQQKLEGNNIRVHVIGDTLFATVIECEVTDYRYTGTANKEVKMSAYVLPESIREMCFTLANSLNLQFCGIDLFLTKDGTYYCFEVNPSPGYSYFEQQSGQKISEALVNWLEFGTCHGSGMGS